MVQTESVAHEVVPDAAVLVRVREIVTEVLAKHSVAVWLFGSWARGDQALGSDIDVAISARETLPRGVLPTLRERLEESTVPYRVDVVDLSTAPAALRDSVMREGITWIR